MKLVEVGVEASHEGQVRRILLPGGELTARSARELSHVATKLAEDRSVRVVVLDARAADFCTGGAPDLDPLDIVPDPASALAALRPPVVAVCRGACRSFGLEVVLATDIRLAAPTATFGIDLRSGTLPCWGGSQRLTRSIRPAAAAGILLLGDELSAEAALHLGLVHTVQSALDDAINDTVQRLLGVGPLALELAKEAVHRGAELPLRDGLRLEGDLNHLLAGTADRAEGLAAFFDKRAPDFAGR